MSGEIKGVTDVQPRRLFPRLGIIRLGRRVPKKSGKDNRCKHGPEELCNYCSYPQDVDYFILPEELEKKLGVKDPKELVIMLPSDDPAQCLPCEYVRYGASGWKCRGDGEAAQEVDEKTGEVEDHECSGPECAHQQEGSCGARGTLFVILPCELGGVYQVGTGSVTAILDCRRDIAYIKSWTATTGCPQGRLARIPLLLKRVGREFTYREGGKSHKSTHWPLQLVLPGGIQELNALREMPDRLFADPRELALPRPAPMVGLVARQKAELENRMVTDTEPPALSPEKRPPLTAGDDSPEARKRARALTMELIKKAGFEESRIFDMFPGRLVLTLEELSVADWRSVYTNVNAERLGLGAAPKVEDEIPPAPAPAANPPPAVDMTDEEAAEFLALEAEVVSPVIPIKPMRFKKFKELAIGEVEALVAASPTPQWSICHEKLARYLPLRKKAAGIKHEGKNDHLR